MVPGREQGPTVDDPTREAIALAFDTETEFRHELWGYRKFRGFNAPTVSGRYIPNKPNFEALSSSIALDLPMYVFGPTGCGKTLAFEYFAATTGRPLLRTG